MDVRDVQNLQLPEMLTWPPTLDTMIHGQPWGPPDDLNSVKEHSDEPDSHWAESPALEVSS
jgi:hypothetical protein